MNADQLSKNKNVLSKYIPDKAVPIIAEWIYRYDFKLKIKKGRATKYGDYRPPIGNKNHQITVNNDMNKFAFLITLIHEVAHLDSYVKYKNNIKPHGNEWKEAYKKLLYPFLNEEFFPNDVIIALKAYINNPAASSCSDLNLLRVLKKYDFKNESYTTVEQVIHGNKFVYNNKTFLKIEKVRKRYKCQELQTKNVYLFNPLTEVIPHIK